jgi:hypothetical protein
MASIRISSKLIEEAMRSATTRAALRKKADEKARRADALGGSEGVQINAEVVEGTRPKGRPYARVQSENVAQEWGSRDVERRRILGRVAEEG